MTNLPATIWQDPNQSVEYTVGSANDIVDPDGNNLVDPDGNQITDTGVTVTEMAGTVWAGDDSV